jgi:hypothetical protein
MTDEAKISVPLLDRCPKCDTATEFGFGLAGGGYGTYVFCPSDACDGYFAKQQCDDGE